MGKKEGAVYPTVFFGSISKKEKKEYDRHRETLVTDSRCFEADNAMLRDTGPKIMLEKEEMGTCPIRISGPKPNEHHQYFSTHSNALEIEIHLMI